MLIILASPPFCSLPTPNEGSFTLYRNHAGRIPSPAFVFSRSTRHDIDEPGAKSNDEQTTTLRIPTPLRRLAGHLAPPSESSKADNRSRQRIKAEKASAQRLRNVADRASHVLWCTVCKRTPLKAADRKDGGEKCSPGFHPTEVPVDIAKAHVLFCARCPRKVCRACYLREIEPSPDQTEWVSHDGRRNAWAEGLW